MPRKVLDISLIEEDKSDLTFFNIDEEDGDETLKALKQSYVTTNYKEETILNLQNSLNSSSEDTSKELKLESYRRYNNALDLACKNYITSAIELIESACDINPKDVDILNLKGLLKLLKCDFSKSFESFYTALCYGNNELSRRYVDSLSSEEFKVFLTRYNHSIRFINEDLSHESIHILDNIISEDPELIEPYVILALLYERLNNPKKKEFYINKLKEYDKDNKILENKVEIKSTETIKEKESVTVKKTNSKKKNIIVALVAIILIIGSGFYYMHNKNKIDSLSNELDKKKQSLTKKEEKLSEVSKELDKTSKELTDEKSKEPDKQIIVADEVSLYEKGMAYKNVDNYEEAIANFKNVVEVGKTKRYKSSAMYEVAFLSEKIKNLDQAKTYYRKYTYAYSPEDDYYDESFYQLGMLYYTEGDLDNAKAVFREMIKKDPNSMYNNSKVKSILLEN